jgi:hypothetical protein
MDLLARAHAMEAFCRQRAKIEDENAVFWLAEAAIWAKQAVVLAKKKLPRTAPPVSSRRQSIVSKDVPKSPAAAVRGRTSRVGGQR